MLDFNITLPTKPKAIKEEGNLGVYEIENLYPGYGYTLGNSLRRILLSSLKGQAITQIKIKGVDHEFSTMDGVKEDVINIILNLKKVRFLLTGTDRTVARIKIKGEKEITAADIECGGELEVMNKDQFICLTTAKNSDVDMEITIESGMGFVQRDIHYKQKTEVGVITLDAIFSPVKYVGYEVENMRVGDRTNYNRLIMRVETDGSLSPKQALESSVAIMISQLQAILNVSENKPEAVIEIKDEEEIKKDDEDLTDILKTRIENLDLSTRTMNALNNANIRTLGGLARKKREDLETVEGMGDKGIKEIEAVLDSFSLALK